MVSNIQICGNYAKDLMLPQSAFNVALYEVNSLVYNTTNFNLVDRNRFVLECSEPAFRCPSIMVEDINYVACDGNLSHFA